MGVLGAKVEAHSLVTVEVEAVLLVVGVREVPGEVLKEVSEVALKNSGLVMVADCSFFCTFYSFFCTLNVNEETESDFYVYTDLL